MEKENKWYKSGFAEYMAIATIIAALGFSAASCFRGCCDVFCSYNESQRVRHETESERYKFERLKLERTSISESEQESLPERGGRKDEPN